MSDSRPLRTTFLLLLAALLGAAAAVWWIRSAPTVTPPPTPLVIERVREVARLETLEVEVYKKIAYAPDPVPTGALWSDVLAWARASLFPSHGRAIVFGTVHLGLDLSKLDAEHLRIHGDRVEVELPPLVAQVELKPAETEVISRNLDSAQTAQLLELARTAFEREALANPALRDRATGSARRALTGLLLTLGFRRVEFVDHLPASGGA
jgi:hypothetical protein